MPNADITHLPVFTSQILTSDDAIANICYPSLVEFDIEQVLATKNATSCRWRFGEYSPVNPEGTCMNIKYQ